MQNEHDTKGELCSIYDINYAGVEDKFVNSILHENQFKLSENNDQVVTEIYYAWRCQSDLNFVFLSQMVSNCYQTQMLQIKLWTHLPSQYMKLSDPPVSQISCKVGSHLIHNLMLRLGKSTYRATRTVN